MERSKIRVPHPHSAEPVIGRRFAPTRWIHAGYALDRNDGIKA
jgi:hypothetical protein